MNEVPKKRPSDRAKLSVLGVVLEEKRFSGQVLLNVRDGAIMWDDAKYTQRLDKLLTEEKKYA